MRKRTAEDGAEKVSPAKAVHVADLIPYANGAIVSRTIAENGGGTITAFSFDAGQGLSEHSAPFDAIVHIVDGEAELTIGGEKMRAPAGSLVVMPANVPHAVRAAGRFKMLLTMLRAGAAGKDRKRREKH
ncbi:MAG: cupin domain-containing protein [Planctomycetota bacterium]|nr:cupin domain-containing protein [Planctomycetota bacterium]